MYKLDKPCSFQERADFIVEHNHENNMEIIETDECIYALENNEVLLNGEITISEAKELEQQKQDEISDIRQNLDNLDKKRIRAICEPEIKDTETGETWLDYYNSQIQELRDRLQELTEGEDNDITN